MLFSFFTANTQNDNSASEKKKKNELKLNALALAIGASLEGTYERNFNEKSSLGVSVLAVFNDHSKYDLNYSLSKYYRRYFIKKICFWSFS